MSFNCLPFLSNVSLAYAFSDIFSALILNYIYGKQNRSKSDHESLSVFVNYPMQQIVYGIFYIYVVNYTVSPHHAEFGDYLNDVLNGMMLGTLNIYEASPMNAIFDGYTMWNQS